MKLPVIASGILVLCVAVACAPIPPAPTADQWNACDCGEKPLDYRQAIARYFDATLKDPASIEYRELTEPDRGYMQQYNRIRGAKRQFGWMVKATVNAKNTYGGYVGYQTYSFLFRGESIVDVMTPDSK